MFNAVEMFGLMIFSDNHTEQYLDSIVSELIMVTQAEIYYMSH